LLAAADAPDDLLLLGEALLWANRHDESFTAKERAYQAYLHAGDDRRAGFVAVLLTVHNAVRLDMSVAGAGWRKRRSCSSRTRSAASTATSRSS